MLEIQAKGSLRCSLEAETFNNEKCLFCIIQQGFIFPQGKFFPLTPSSSPDPPSMFYSLYSYLLIHTYHKMLFDL